MKLKKITAVVVFALCLLCACVAVLAEEGGCSVTLPKTATEESDYGGYWSDDKLTDIFVEEGNEAFRSIDGVLFTADGKTLLLYPKGRTEDRYVVPEGTERIESNFEYYEESYVDDEGNEERYEGGCRLKTLVLPASFRSFEEDCLYFSKIESFEVDPENPFFCAIDGVLFSKDQKVLAVYPQGRPDKSYTVPEGVVEIGPYAFYTNRNLTSVFLPDSVNVIEDYAFQECYQLETVSLPDHMERIGFRTFYGCDKLSGIRIPEGLTEIEGEMLWGTAQQGALHIPEGITRIGQDAFRFQYTLTDIYWPDSLDSLVDYDSAGDLAVMKGSDAHLYMAFGWNDVRLVDFAVVMHAHEGTPAAEWVKDYPHVIAPRGVDTMDADGYAELCSRLMREAGYSDVVICYNPEMELMAVKPLAAYNLHQAVAVFRQREKLLLCGFDDSDGEWALRWVNERFLDDGNLPVGMSFYGEEELEIILPDAGKPLEENAFAYYFDARTFKLQEVRYCQNYMFREYETPWKCGIQDNMIIYATLDQWKWVEVDGQREYRFQESEVFATRPLEPGNDYLMTAARMQYPSEQIPAEEGKE